mmetsp:Transcript_9765/g.16119  ORF Transcript_9765/g.16119 Transcript_9765/m.16119 type:complete len:235 (+) Transcript_9765:389-1093(+)
MDRCVIFIDNNARLYEVIDSRYTNGNINSMVIIVFQGFIHSCHSIFIMSWTGLTNISTSNRHGLIILVSMGPTLRIARFFGMVLHAMHCQIIGLKCRDACMPSIDISIGYFNMHRSIHPSEYSQSNVMRHIKCSTCVTESVVCHSNGHFLQQCVIHHCRLVPTRSVYLLAILYMPYSSIFWVSNLSIGDQWISIRTRSIHRGQPSQCLVWTPIHIIIAVQHILDITKQTGLYID